MTGWCGCGETGGEIADNVHMQAFWIPMRTYLASSPGDGLFDCHLRNFQCRFACFVQHFNKLGESIECHCQDTVHLGKSKQVHQLQTHTIRPYNYDP